MSYAVTGEIWRYSGEAAWHVVTLPADVADEIAARYAGDHRPFGSLPVRVTLGATSWTTSLFRDTKAGSYLIPIKADVRRRAAVGDGDTVALQIEVAG